MMTGNYSKCKNHPNAVSISIGTPKGFNGGHATELKPTWAMVKAGYTYEEYVMFLMDRGVDPKEVAKKYEGKIMLCYEKDRTNCHRGYFARWMKETIGLEVPEYEVPKESSNANIGQMLLL
ncbi:MAG: hypothetical protein EPO24_03315 [Bacteroidetes bacterium]|nr:MAG: hypothetical protein EPO24_03315 [Bacteroidota bacterium]